MRLTKLTTTSITAARPSIRTPIENDPPAPRSIQSTENSIGAPPPGTIPATNRRAKTEKTREIVTPRMATYWAFSLRRRPKKTSTRKTSAGSTGIAVMISCWPTVCTGSPLASHRGYFVDVHGPPRAEHGENYSKSNGDLSRRYGDHQHRVADAEATGTGEIVSEGDERQVDAVYHKLDAHKDDDGVAPDQSPPRPDGEQDSPDDEVTLERRRGDERLDKLLHLARHLGHYSRTPRSTPSPILRRLTTIAATTATRSSTEATSKRSVKISAPWLTPSRSRPKAPTSRGPLPAFTPAQSSAASTYARKRPTPMATRKPGQNWRLMIVRYRLTCGFWVNMMPNRITTVTAPT